MNGSNREGPVVDMNGSREGLIMQGSSREEPPAAMRCSSREEPLAAMRCSSREEPLAAMRCSSREGLAMQGSTEQRLQPCMA
eukprot:314919-Chlamydomonas_euryale.AAC.1